ncbi:hypothetical protein ACFVH9_35780 [Streptomyces hirsutus]
MPKNRRTRHLLNRCSVALLLGAARGAGMVLGAAGATAALPFLQGLLG